MKFNLFLFFSILTIISALVTLLVIACIVSFDLANTPAADAVGKTGVGAFIVCVCGFLIACLMDILDK